MSRNRVVPIAPLTAQVKGLYSIPRLGLICDFHPSWASVAPTADGLMLQREDKKSMGRLLFRREHSILSHPLGGNTERGVEQ